MRITDIIGGASIALAASLLASETTTYQYDVHGRLIGVVRSGGPNDDVDTTYSYDEADSRTQRETTGAALAAMGVGMDATVGSTAEGIGPPLTSGLDPEEIAGGTEDGEPQ